MAQKFPDLEERSRVSWLKPDVCIAELSVELLLWVPFGGFRHCCGFLLVVSVCASVVPFGGFQSVPARSCRKLCLFLGLTWPSHGMSRLCFSFGITVVFPMPIVRFHCPFAGLSGCRDGGGNGLTKTSLITHLRDRHFNGEAQAITRHSLVSDLVIFERAEVTLKRMGLWLCGGCFKTHTFRAKCRHGGGSDFVSPPDCGDGVVRFVLYDLTKPQVPSHVSLVGDLVLDELGGFDLPLLETLLSKGLRTVKSIPPKCKKQETLISLLDKLIFGKKIIWYYLTRWSLITHHLPGWTDTEIKNHWHSYLKKKVPKLEIETQPIPEYTNST
ncbi:hypothetical protein CTI12_AA493850 [Artemisia annua]|uniref:HTH myb-type domain-containing protein n=1 Tax=Artemisia annua TaxID=35608 RepID=A0A2U1LGM0_ARTAN|nr:hypothetical protein CTI12_AA493850 [Artemisia annua]